MTLSMLVSVRSEYWLELLVVVLFVILPPVLMFVFGGERRAQSRCCSCDCTMHHSTTDSQE